MDAPASMAPIIPATMTAGSMWRTANTLTQNGQGRMSTGTAIIVEGTHEAIISKETFLLAQRVIRRGNHEPRKVSNYPLRGLVCCGNCKRTMTRRKLKDGSVFYTCHHSNHDRDTECRVGEKYSESRLEDIVYNAIGDFLTFTEKQAVQNREVGDIRKTAIKDCAAKLKALQTQTDQL